MARILYKYNALNAHFYDALEKGYFFYAKASSFNDAFDSVIPYEFKASVDDIESWGINGENVNPLIARYLKENPEYLCTAKGKAVLQKSVDAIREYIYVYCLSENCDDRLMWAYYGGSCTGICIGYKVDIYGENHFLKTDGSFQSEFIPIGMANLSPVKYRDYCTEKPLPYNVFKMNIDVLAKGLRVKDILFKHEQEYRSIIIDDKSKPHIKIPFPKEILKEVIFAVKTKYEDIIKVINTIKNYYDTKDIDFYQIQLDLQTYNFIREHLNINEYV
jgi:hypothetical protein